MISWQAIIIEGKKFSALQVRLPKTTLISISNDIGYIMCGALNISFFNDQLPARKIITGRAEGVKTFEELLNSPLVDITTAAFEKGVRAGMTGKEALLVTQ